MRYVKEQKFEGMQLGELGHKVYSLKVKVWKIERSIAEVIFLIFDSFKLYYKLILILNSDKSVSSLYVLSSMFSSRNWRAKRIA